MTDSSRSFNKLHLGCGSVTPDGWLNVDGSYGAWLARHPFLRGILKRTKLISAQAANVPWSASVYSHDLTRPLPFPNNSFIAVYSSHTLEHLYLSETIALLREVFRVLAPGGVVRMVVPDLRAWVDDYLGVRSVYWPPEEYEPQTAGDRFNRNLLCRTWDRPGVSFLRRLMGSRGDLHSHKWMFDADSLAFHIRNAGFVDVERRDFLQSRIADIASVEKRDRVEEGQGVAVEGVKPESAKV